GKFGSHRCSHRLVGHRPKIATEPESVHIAHSWMTIHPRPGGEGRGESERSSNSSGDSIPMKKSRNLKFNMWSACAPRLQINSLIRFSKNSCRPLWLVVTSPILSA